MHIYGSKTNREVVKKIILRYLDILKSEWEMKTLAIPSFDDYFKNAYFQRKFVNYIKQIKKKSAESKQVRIILI
jgi:hypothetical protein